MNKNKDCIGTEGKRASHKMLKKVCILKTGIIEIRENSQSGKQRKRK